MVEPKPLVAMVVNNPIAHDARVVKTAATLARAGADVHVLGVSASGLRERAVSDSAGGSGSAVFERLPVLPLRGVTAGYVWWAGIRRFGRAFPAEQWRRSIPVTAYYHRAFLPALRALAPDVIHVHDIHLLATVVEYAASATHRPHVVYDAHEFVAGLAVSGARTQRAVDGWAALERQFIRSADRVITVADGLAGRLQELHHLERRPAVVHNAPIAWGFDSAPTPAPAGAPAPSGSAAPAGVAAPAPDGAGISVPDGVAAPAPAPVPDGAGISVPDGVDARAPVPDGAGVSVPDGVAAPAPVPDGAGAGVPVPAPAPAALAQARPARCVQSAVSGGT